MVVPWVKDDEAILVEMWARGCSTHEIADRLGRRRNSIIGKAHRMDLAKHQNTRKNLMDTPRVPRQQYKIAKPPTIPQPIPVVMPSSGVSFMKVKDSQCHAIIGRDRDGYKLVRYCGVPVKEDSSYCPTHSRQFFNHR